MKKQYTAPILTVVSVCVERGYAQSASVTADEKVSMDALFSSGGFGATESRNHSSNWTLSRDGRDENDENFWTQTY